MTPVSQNLLWHHYNPKISLIHLENTAMRGVAPAQWELLAFLKYPVYNNYFVFTSDCDDLLLIYLDVPVHYFVSS